MDVINSFYSKMEKTESCWNWVASKTLGGYGKMWIGDKIADAHRWSWEYHNNACLAKGVSVLHKCDNPGCVNPDHLFLGTQTKLTSEDVMEIRELYKTGNYTHKQLGDLYGVKRHTITRIINGTRWKYESNSL